MYYVVLFGRDNCKYCDLACNLIWKLDGMGYVSYFEKIEFDGHDKYFLEKLIGKKIDTVPQIFINGNYIGGYKELKEWVGCEFGLYDLILENEFKGLNVVECENDTDF